MNDIPHIIFCDEEMCDINDEMDCVDDIDMVIIEIKNQISLMKNQINDLERHNKILQEKLNNYVKIYGIV